MSITFTPTVNIRPHLNDDGSYTLRVSAYELNELMKGLRYMEKQRESTRKYRDNQRGTTVRHPPKLLSLNILPPVTAVPAH